MTRQAPGQIAAIAARLKTLCAAAAGDILDGTGLPDRRLDLAIRPLPRVRSGMDVKAVFAKYGRM